MTNQDPRRPSAEYHHLTTFRCLTDDEVGQMQHFMLDCGATTKEMAKRYGCSVATAQKVRKSIPLEFVECNFTAWGAARKEIGKKGTRKAKRTRRKTA